MSTVRTMGTAVRTLRTPGGISLRFRPRTLLATTVLLLAALTMAVVSVGSGDYPMSPADVIRTLTGDGTPSEVFIVEELRLPRVATALLVGAALALGGTLFQTLVRNPLGSPDVLGFTHGASTGALTAVVVLGGGTWALAGGAVVGGLLTGLLVYGLAWRDGTGGYRLVLTGIGVATILTGVNGYLLTQAKLMEAARVLLWLTGSLDGRGWDNVLPLAVTLAVLVPVVLLGCARPLHQLEMGDDTASALGVRVERLRLVLLLTAVVLTAFAAAAAGPVSFVALTAPLLARRMTGAPGPNLLPSLCAGAALLVTADWAAQRAIDGHQLPVGVVTGVLGGGCLVWLMAVQRKKGRI
ncbi:FecCD family ABC transporter permease [Streptomyces gamaensis]|uniref:FecCD family ABC transporter permease n=1 Tax=Streptomyces gamaensis TaxID=1763542 RepID=A0ABW0YY06_9ACTN